MTSIVKNVGKYGVTMTQGHHYYAVVHDKSAEWHCFNITKEGTYKITCNGVDDYTVEEKDPPPDAEQDPATHNSSPHTQDNV